MSLNVTPAEIRKRFPVAQTITIKNQTALFLVALTSEFATTKKET